LRVPVSDPGSPGPPSGVSSIGAVRPWRGPPKKERPFFGWSVSPCSVG